MCSGGCGDEAAYGRQGDYLILERKAGASNYGISDSGKDIKECREY